jgi:hypothetical protein
MNKKPKKSELGKTSQPSATEEAPTKVTADTNTKKPRKTKKTAMAKQTLENILEISKTVKKGIFPPKSLQKDSTKIEGDLLENYKAILRKTPVTKLGQVAKSFLSELRDQKLKEGKMPEVIESHADISYIEDEINISSGPLRLARGNWIQLDLGSKEANEQLKTALEELGEPTNPKLSKISMLPTTFLMRNEAILEILRNSEPKNSTTFKKYENQVKVLSNLCMAYLEVVEEGLQDPPENATTASTRPYKAACDAVAFFKKILLDQAVGQSIQDGAPNPSDKEIASKVKNSISTTISTKEAVELSCILAEREIEGFKHSYKRETLFKMRAFLASKFFNEAKKYRGEQECPEDRILGEKPRYKTPCVWLVLHRNNQRSEVLAVKPTTNVSYWGNPDSEKDKYSIVPINQPQNIWDKFNKQVITEKIVKHQSSLTWGLVIFSILCLSIGMFAELPEKRNAPLSDGINQPQSQTQSQTQTQTQKPAEQNNMIEKPLDISEISPNNVGGAYSMRVNTPAKNKAISKSNSVEW